jgi:predicted ArsR family transcriptional regulator
MTVDELAVALDLTRTAVRAQLATLLHEELIEQRGTRRGTSKPARLYGVMTQAELLFSRAYIPILTQLLHVLARRMSPVEFDSLMRVGTSVIKCCDRYARERCCFEVPRESSGPTEVQH